MSPLLLFPSYPILRAGLVSKVSIALTNLTLIVISVATIGGADPAYLTKGLVFARGEVRLE